jgi:hypothetical protein
VLPQTQGSAGAPAWYPPSVAPTTGIITQPRAAVQQAPPVASPANRPRAGILPSIVDAGAIIGGAARLWWRHWPVLFAVYFFGVGAKQWLLQLGVLLSKTSATLGFLVFLIGPLVLLICFVAMLMVVRAPSSLADTRPTRASALLRQVTSVLIPFVGVYLALGLLHSDQTTYFYQVFADEVLANPAIFTDPASVDVLRRLPLAVNTVLFVLLAVVVVLRWLVPRWRNSRAWLVVALVSAYLELLWVGWLAKDVGLRASWLSDRQVFGWLSAGWARLTATLGPGHAVTDWVAAQLGAAEGVLLAPVAWLLLAAVISRREPISATEDGPREASAPRWLAALPGLVRWLANGVLTDLRTRFGPLVNGIRVILRAGLIPMVVLCIAVAALLASPRWVWEVERLVIGPQDLGTRWIPLSYWLAPFNDAFAIVGVTCVVAAAVQRVQQRGVRLLAGTEDSAQAGAVSQA